MVSYNHYIQLVYYKTLFYTATVEEKMTTADTVIIILGTLLGLSLVILVAVITGWACTFAWWTTKKKEERNCLQKAYVHIQSANII